VLRITQFFDGSKLLLIELFEVTQNIVIQYIRINIPSFFALPAANVYLWRVKRLFDRWSDKVFDTGINPEWGMIW
jgi:hypothetical protein